MTEESKPFHALDAATGNARSPSVERFVGATTNVSATEERIHGDDRRRDMSGWCREGIRAPKRITGTESAPGPAFMQWSSCSSGDT